MELLTTNNVWMMICTGLVFFMHLGFTFLESGMTRQKNTVNILFKNFFVITMGLLVYAIGGFNLMYPGDFNGYFGFAGWGLDSVAAADLAYNEGYTYWTDFLFQGMFAATAATIVSGAVAERIKLGAFMLYALLLVAFVYPIVGSWQWGGGFFSTFTEEVGFYDFAGSTLVHSVGGWAALVAIVFLGARVGRFDKDGKPNAIPGHNLPISAAGVLILWLGWFGFNGGSVLSANPGPLGLVFTTTALAGCAGCLAAMFFSWIFLKKPDVSMALNGILAGLVGITAGADSMGPWAAVIVGLIAGVLVVLSIIFFDSIKIDDPVGAISVHGVCGIWGTVAVGIFGGADLGTQITGTVSVSIAAFIFAYVVFSIIKVIMGVRVTAEEEAEGLDLAEHGQSAYNIS